MGAIEGVVKSFNEVPLKDIRVIIMAGPSRHDLASVTDANGSFAISNLKPGHYIIKAFGKSESDGIAVQVNKNQIAFVQIWLKTDQNYAQDNDDSSEVIGEVNFFEDKPSSGLLATKWKIESIKPIGKTKSQIANQKYLLDFNANNQFSFNTDVNSCNGNFVIESKGKIIINNMSCTEAGGDSLFATEFMNLLPQITSYEVKGNLLFLKGKDEIILTRYYDEY